MRGLPLTLVPLLLACSGGGSAGRPSPTAASSPASPSASAAPSASPAPVRLPVAILVDAASPNAGSPPATYSIALVAADGSVTARASAHLPSQVPVLLQNCPQFGPGASSPGPCQAAFRPWAPLVTSSNSRAYFLDGDSDVGYLTPDGRTGTAVRFPAGPKTRYAVAVSPDDSRVAVASFDYSGAGTWPRPDLTLSIYVQDLNGAGRVDLFSSTTAAEWPIGWHDGHLVIAVGPAGVVQSAAPNPYFANTEYHVADAATGVRLTTLGAGECVYGPLVKAGTACQFGGDVLGYQTWDGAKHQVAPSPGIDPAALSPDGLQLAGSTRGAQNAQLAMISTAGVKQLSVTGAAEAWLDAGHLFYRRSSAAPSASNQTYILDLATGASATVPQTTPQQYLQFLGTVPQQIG